ncbi:MAG: ABC transporter permease [Nocardioidaceae bacterium]
MSAALVSDPARVTARARVLATLLPRLVAPVMFGAVLVTFTLLSGHFLTATNLLQVADEAALLAIVAIGMTVVVRAGGIDLSIGVALDLGALTTAHLLSNGYVTVVALVGGVLTGVLIGAVNAVLVLGLRITPFMATLSVWFVGTSAQQILTDGGSPVYLRTGTLPLDFVQLSDAELLGLSASAWTAIVMAVLVGAALTLTRWGRVLTMSGDQPEASRVVGVRTRLTLGTAYVVAAALAGVAGFLLVSRSNGYVPNSGQAYLLDAVGAVFVGATLSSRGFTTVVGTLVGVLLFALLANGLSLAGISYFWEGLARGVVLLTVLVVVTRLRKRARSG